MMTLCPGITAIMPLHVLTSRTVVSSDAPPDQDSYVDLPSDAVDHRCRCTLLGSMCPKGAVSVPSHRAEFPGYGGVW